jgi:hypothetical protein
VLVSGEVTADVVWADEVDVQRRVAGRLCVEVVVHPDGGIYLRLVLRPAAADL